MNTGQTCPSRILCALLLGLLSAPVPAQEDGIATAIGAGKGAVALRYRYEFVDQDGFADDAHASTVRLRLNYETGDWQGWSAFTEFDQLMEAGPDEFNSGAGTSSGERDRYPVVADPNGSDLNQLFLAYTTPDELVLRFGRQRILLDDQRFVGGVGWRQNEQTFDAASLRYTGPERTTLFYAYLVNVNRIFGNEVPAGDNESQTHLLNLKVQLSQGLGVVGYAYLIDNEDVPAFSTNTYGLRANGQLDWAGGRLGLLGEFARQSDAANAPASFDADYYRLEAAWRGERVTIGAGLESLGSDDGEGFRTPLATLHAFNGWADQFLSTPDAGLEDFYVKLGYTLGGWMLQGIYHDFGAESGGGDFGTEIDLAASRKLGERYQLLLKFARFSADDATRADTTKFWLMLSAGF